MKNFLLLLTFSIGIQGWTHAQSTDTTASQEFPGIYSSPHQKNLSPLAQRAARQLNTLHKKLNLNQDQVIQLRMVLLNLNVALDSLRTNPSGDKKMDNKTRRTIMQEADGKTYALLTTQQQLLYAQWKEDKRAKANTPPKQP